MADTSRVIVRSPSDAFIEEISPSDIFAMTRTEEVNGEHSLEVTTTVVLQKEMRLLTADHTGKWHEWVVMGEDTDHASGLTPIGTYYAVWSIQHDLALTKVDKMPGTQSPVTAGLALADALSGTKRWTAGTVTRTTTGGASMWYKSGWDALSTVVDVWGGEIDATITVANDGTVTSRKVDLYSKMGQQTARRRFDWGHDLKGIRRKVDEAPMAVRIIPRGKGEETGSGGYGRKITIESVNGGIEWLQNDETAQLYRLPDGNGGWEYPTIVVENGNIDNPAELKSWGLSVLEDYTTPKVTYESDVMQLAQAGMDVTGVALGDAVQCVDKGFSEDGLRVSGRVMKMTVNELDETDIKLTIGHLTAGLAGSLSSISKLTATVAAMNGGSLTTADYLNALLERLNGEINATGGYTYVTQGQGLRTYDKRVSDPLVGSEATKVVEIKGGTIRIADSRTSQGAWDWKTVFVSGHVAADLVTAAKITTGYIRSPSGTFVDLDNNTAQMGSTNAQHTKFDGSGMTVYDEGNNSILFAGKESGESVISIGRYNYSSSMKLSKNSLVLFWKTDEIMNISANGTTSSYTFGHRTSGSSVGNHSAVIGDYNVASGGYSLAAGYACQSSGEMSIALGERVTAENEGQVAVGRYNISHPEKYSQVDVMFVVGDGYSGTRRDAMVVYERGNVTIAGTLTQNSDRRLKEHHAYLGDDAAEFIRRLRPALYTKDGERHVGFYAQNVQEAEPDGWNTATVKAQHTDESLDFDPLTLDYTALIAPLVAYAQSLEKRIEELEEKLA